MKSLLMMIGHSAAPIAQRVVCFTPGGDRANFTQIHHQNFDESFFRGEITLSFRKNADGFMSLGPLYKKC